MIDSVKLRRSISFKAQTTRIKTYTVGILSTFVVLVLLLFVILPVISKITQEQGLYNDLNKNYATLTVNLSNLAQAQNSYESTVKGNTSVLDMALPGTPETGPLFANINAIASAQKVQITSIKYQKATDVGTLPKDVLANIVVRPGLSYLFFTMDGNGPLSQITAFEGALESYPRTFNFLTTSISFPAKNSKTTDVDFNISGYVYYLTPTS